MNVKIETRRDWELHVKQTVAKMQVSNKYKVKIREIAMYCFDAGLAYSQGNLTVKVDV